MSSAATWILCTKIVLISTGAISIAMAIKFSVPSIMAFAFYDVPTIWRTLVSWFKPPYLYFILNGIIITIAASSCFSHKAENSESTHTQPLVSVKTLPPSHIVAATIQVQPLQEVNVVGASPEMVYEAEDESEANIVELKPVVVNGIIEAVADEAYEVLDDDGHDFVISQSTCTPEADDMPPEKIISPDAQLDNFLLPVKEKPLRPSRFGYRQPVKAIPEGGRSMRVAKPKEEETLESIWKMIMEGRQRQLKKSDTFENHGSHLDVHARDDHDGDVPLPQRVLKSETFRDRPNYDADDEPPTPAVPALGWSSNMGKIRKELSLSQEELNRRVEAFIKKFNEDMRLQRQESINRYMEMINRGAN